MFAVQFVLEDMLSYASLNGGVFLTRQAYRVFKEINADHLLSTIFEVGPQSYQRIPSRHNLERGP